MTTKTAYRHRGPNTRRIERFARVRRKEKLMSLNTKESDMKMTTQQLCEWFALCTNPATTTEPHVVLGEVPICARCQKKIQSGEVRAAGSDA